MNTLLSKDIIDCLRFSRRRDEVWIICHGIDLKSFILFIYFHLCEEVTGLILQQKWDNPGLMAAVQHMHYVILNCLTARLKNI